jgi:hypothetical protein
MCWAGVGGTSTIVIRAAARRLLQYAQVDAEKTIQFLLENAAQHDNRLAAIETNMLAIESNILTLGNGLISLTAVVKTLADNLVHLEKIAEEHEIESRDRDAALDARIGKLVTAIAALAKPQGGEALN